MKRPEDKTVIVTPKGGAEPPSDAPPLQGNALPAGYLLQDRYIIEAQLGAGGFGITEDIGLAVFLKSNVLAPTNVQAG